MAKQMCQSCGRPLKEDVKGTEADGSLSQQYCNLCYKDGSFIDPDITLEEMQVICVKAMRDMHFPGFLAKRIAKNQLPQLERWKTPA